MPRPKGSKSNIPENETAMQRFERVCGGRVNNALRAIDSIGGCTNRKTYEYTAAYVSVIVTELTNAVKSVNERFRIALAGTPEKKAPVFSFKQQNKGAQ